MFIILNFNLSFHAFINVFNILWCFLNASVFWANRNDGLKRNFDPWKYENKTRKKAPECNKYKKKTRNKERECNKVKPFEFIGIAMNEPRQAGKARRAEWGISRTNQKHKRPPQSTCHHFKNQRKEMIWEISSLKKN